MATQPKVGFTVTLAFDQQRVEDLLTNALEGGSNYWYRIDEYNYGYGRNHTDFKFPHIQVAVEGGFVLFSVPEDEDGKQYKLDRSALRRGLAIMARKYPRHFADWVAENDDAETGDVFLQCCLFGETVYG